MKIISIICICVLEFFFMNGHGQFELVPSEIPMSTVNPNLGSGISLVDFDRDGLDDLTVLDVLDGVSAYHSNGDGTFELVYNFIPGYEINQALWVDYDNDDDYDLFLAGRFQSNLLYRNEGEGIFTDVSLDLNPNGVVSDSQGCSWGDYDRDGWLDLFVAHNIETGPTNWLFHNLGDGTFEEIAFQLGVDGGSMNSLQATFIDLDFNCWQDIYVCEDRHGGNRCFLNVDGVFTESGVTNGSGVEIDAMSNSFADFDLDGDIDIYIANNSQGNVLLKNNNGYFTDVAPELGISVYQNCWSSVWLDYDMDGWQDLYVCETESFAIERQNLLFHHTDTNDFVLINDIGLAGDNFNTYSSGKFDYNGDAIWDLATANTLPPSISVWKNVETSLNSVKLDLHGTISNHDGIGSTLRAYHNGQCKAFQSYCGENYLAQESHYEMIGLGSDTLIDSLVITWPSCWVDRYYNIPAHSFLHLYEGETFSAEIVSNSGGFICPSDDEVILSSSSLGEYYWSTGDTSAQIVIDTAGTYQLVVINNFGFTDTSTFTVNPFEEVVLSTETIQPACASENTGEIHILNADDFEHIEMNENWNGPDYENLFAGIYTLFGTDTNGCIREYYVEILEPLPLSIELSFDSIACYGGVTSIVPQTAGGTGDLELIWNTDTPENVVSGEYNCLVQDENNCVAFASVLVPEPDPITTEILYDTACYAGTTSVQVVISGGVPNYTVNWFGASPGNLEAGFYTIEISDQNECFVSYDFEIAEYPELGFTAVITEPFNGSNGQIELITFGGSPPYFFEWDSNATMNPLQNIGQGSYSCTITDIAGCTISSEPILLVDSRVTELQYQQFTIYPNPFSEILNFITNGQDIKICDFTGRIVYWSQQKDASRIQTGSWSPGVYVASIGAEVFVLTKVE